MLRGRIPVLLMLVLFAGHPVAGLVCQVGCGARAPEPAAQAQRAVQGPGCHPAAPADGAVPVVRLAEADAQHCEHDGTRVVLTAERWHVFEWRVQASDAIETLQSPPRRDSRAPRDAASRYLPPGPRVGFGLAIRV
jgi:hypothetical protein